jgi:hypothetical protein
VRPPGRRRRLLHFAIVIFVSSFCGATACTEETPTTKSSSSGSSGSSGVAAPASAKFNADVIPILATNCALAACHSSKEADGGIYMTYDKEQLYSVFQKTSAAWKIKYVVPGKPEESLLMAKMDGTQAKLCKSSCGNQMPQEELLPEEEREIVRVWIKNGAKND